METFGLSETHYNQCVKKGVFEGHHIIDEEDPTRKMEKQITGGTKSPRKRSASTLRKKARVEREPFSIVYCDGFEGAVGGAAESYSRHQYVLRFVCGSTGYQKSFSCLTKDRFVDAFRMFQAWVLAVAPIIEAHRNLPKGYIRCRVIETAISRPFPGRHETHLTRQHCERKCYGILPISPTVSPAAPWRVHLALQREGWSKRC